MCRHQTVVQGSVQVFRSLCNSSASLFGPTVKQSQGLPGQHVVDTQHPAGGLFRLFVAKEGALTVAC